MGEERGGCGVLCKANAVVVNSRRGLGEVQVHEHELGEAGWWLLAAG